jgi:NAD(P)-dependent dehydrogenase (short-subunit alcohol dehydrogenase family)
MASEVGNGGRAEEVRMNGSSLKGRVALITGATSGIGRATALEFAAHGADLVLTGRSKSRGKEVLDDVRRAGVQCDFVEGDVREDAFCRRAVRHGVDKFSRLDILVNNAGVIFRATAEETSDDMWDETMATNVTAIFHLSRAALPHLRRTRGAIVNIASDWGLRGGERALAYCASKGAVVLMTRAMARDCARDGIRVNAVCPGDTDTPMIAAEIAQRGLDEESTRADYDAAVPLGRMGRPDEIAKLVRFLASDESAYMTGAAVPIDGGSSA